MLSKLLTFCLAIFVALVGIFALMIVTYTASYDPVSTTSFAQESYGPDNDFGDLPDAATRTRQESAMLAEPATVRSHLQIRLSDARVRRVELAQEYGLNHPEVWALDRKIQAMEAQLDVGQAAVASAHPPLSPELQNLQKKIAQAEQDAAKRAQSINHAGRNNLDDQAKRSLRQELQKAVQTAFDLRMQLQNAQLDDAEAKLAASRQRLDRRQTLASQIVDRRVNELLGNDETKWVANPKEIGVVAKVSPRYPLKPAPIASEDPALSADAKLDSDPAKPQRTRFGLIYRDNKKKYPEAIAVSAVGDVGRVKIMDSKTPHATSAVIGATKVTISCPGGPGSSTTFVLPAVGDDEGGYNSLFELKNADLVDSMKHGHYTVSFDNDGKRQVYDVFQHADVPLVPRLQVVHARKLPDTEETKKAVADDIDRRLLTWAPPGLTARGKKRETVLVAHRFAESPIDENDILRATVKQNEHDKEYYRISVELTFEAGDRMSIATKRLLEQSKEHETICLAMLIDGEVVMAPRLNDMLSNTFEITGNFTKSEAEKLVASLD